jgi:hypothetical protein
MLATSAHRQVLGQPAGAAAALEADRLARGVDEAGAGVSVADRAEPPTVLSTFDQA